MPAQQSIPTTKLRANAAQLTAVLCQDRRSTEQRHPHDGAAHCMQVQVRQQEDDAEYRVLARSETAAPLDDGNVLRDYFNAGTSLGELAKIWASKDPRFCSVHPYFPGAPTMWCRRMPASPAWHNSLQSYGNTSIGIEVDIVITATCCKGVGLHISALHIAHSSNFRAFMLK